MKKIVLNGETLFGEEYFGIRRNTQELLRELDAMVSPDEFEIIVPRGDETCIKFENIQLTPIGDPLPVKGKLKRKIAEFKWLNYNLPKYMKREDVLSLDTQLTFPLFGCDVIEIYDCIPELFPGMYNNLRKKVHRKILMLKQGMATKKCKLVLTCSEFSKKDIQKIYSVPESKIAVIPCAWQHFERVSEDLNIFDRIGVEKNSYFFALGSRSYHKNARWVIAAAEKNPDEIFVITGSALGYEDKEAKQNKLKNVIFTGYLNDEEVKALMHYCKAFIQPSMYEGFGIPPMEAMSVGANCIVAKAGSLPEVYKDSVWYIEPMDYDNIDLKEIMSRPKEDNSAILEEYSWKKSAEKLLEVLRGIV